MVKRLERADVGEDFFEPDSARLPSSCSMSSYLISCSHSWPCGGAITSLQSCGLTQFGRPGGLPRGRLAIDFAITAAREVLADRRRGFLQTKSED